MTAPRWMQIILVLAGIYNLAWGTLVVLFPLAWFRWAGMTPPNYPQLWQCIGMIVGVYGVGYLIAARDPYRHWPITLVGFLGKLFGPIGFLQAALAGDFPWVAGVINITNDLIWLVPFALILLGAYRFAEAERRTNTPTVDEALRTARTQTGVSLTDLSKTTPVLLVFLRHFG